MKITNQRLTEIKALKYPKLDWRELFTITSGKTLEDKDEETVRKYFSHFADIGFKAREHFAIPIYCIGCDNELVGGIMGFLIGGAAGKTSLDWSITHGEAHCVKCSWPYRVYHRNVGPIEFVSIALPYHPSEIQLRENKDEC